MVFDLTAVNGKDEECFGETVADVGIPGLRCSYTRIVAVTDTMNPLLGADFLHHYSLILDCSNGRLIDETTRQYTQGRQVIGQIQSITVNNQDTLLGVQSLLQEFAKITRPCTEQPLVSNTKVTHIIDTGDSTLSYVKVWQLSEDKYKSAKQDFIALLQGGVIRLSKSIWSSPIYLVPKSTPGKWQVCGNFRHPNQLTKPDKYPIPNINGIFKDWSPTGQSPDSYE